MVFNEQNNTDAKDKLMTIVDIGTEAIKVLIGGRASSAQNNEVPPICIYGTGRAISNCSGSDNMPIDIRKGEIINVDKIQKRIELAIKEAEEESAMDATDTVFYVGINGQYIRTENVESTIRIDGTQITDDDLIKVLRIANEKCQTELQGNILQICTRYFKTEQGISYDVLNQVTRNLHACVQAAVCTNSQKYSTLRLMMRNATGQDAFPLYVPMLPGYAGMDTQQREKHSLSIDIGAGLTSFSINTLPGMMDYGHIPVGCNHLENDLMLGLDIDWEAARHIVHNLNRISQALANENEHQSVRLKHKGGQREKDVPIQSIMTIVNARIEEIFQLVRKELKLRNSWDLIFGKVFISGGGALLPDICKTASRILELEAEIARPGTDVICNTNSRDFMEDPRWIVPIGMLKMAVFDHEIRNNVKYASKTQENGMDGIFRSIFKMLINW